MQTYFLYFKCLDNKADAVPCERLQTTILTKNLCININSRTFLDKGCVVVHIYLQQNNNIRRRQEPSVFCCDRS